MALIDTVSLMRTLQVKDFSASNVALFDQLRRRVEAAVKAYVKWGLEEVAGEVQYLDGNGYIDLVLPHPFVTAITDLRVDPTGAFGYGNNAFAAGTALINGTDYALVRDGRSGLVRRLTYPTFWWPSDLFFWRGPGGLAVGRRPGWPMGNGNIKVTYTYGMQTIPDDIKLAVETAAGMVVNSVRFGWPVQSENMGDYSYSLNISRDIDFGSVRSLLNPYRDTPI